MLLELGSINSLDSAYMYIDHHDYGFFTTYCGYSMQATRGKDMLQTLLNKIGVDIVR